jgi:hypothetical protein
MDYKVGLINLWLMYKAVNNAVLEEKLKKQLIKKDIDLATNTTLIIDDI